jgi:Ca-activated chloride channel family protein
MLRSKENMLVVLATVIGILIVGGPSEAGPVQLRVSPSSKVLLAGRGQTAYLKVGLTGFPIERVERRTPVNVAIVLDQSGSMGGKKIEKAREAAKLALGQLGPDDIVSIIAYNDSVDVLVPATKVSDKASLYKRIDRIDASGNTALFAGVSKGAFEVRKFIEHNRVNRVILLSDGLANVGPSSAGELAELGASFLKEGISVSTIGLGTGYNEDLMAALARASDGNHAFAENADDLASIFSYEFGDLLSVVAREVTIEVQCGPGIRPIRVLGRDGEIYGRKVVARLNQIYSNQEKYLLIEVRVPARPDGTSMELASVQVSYADTLTRQRDTLASRAQIGFSVSNALVEGSRDSQVTIAQVEMVANETNRRAVELRDKGHIAEAEKVLSDNAAYLQKKAKKYKSKKLRRFSEDNLKDKENMKGGKWRTQRKAMRKRQHAVDLQQAW